MNYTREGAACGKNCLPPHPIRLPPHTTRLPPHHVCLPPQSTLCPLALGQGFSLEEIQALNTSDGHSLAHTHIARRVPHKSGHLVHVATTYARSSHCSSSPHRNTVVSQHSSHVVTGSTNFRRVGEQNVNLQHGPTWREHTCAGQVLRSAVHSDNIGLAGCLTESVCLTQGCYKGQHFGIRHSARSLGHSSGSPRGRFALPGHITLSPECSAGSPGHHARSPGHSARSPRHSSGSLESTVVGSSGRQTRSLKGSAGQRQPNAVPGKNKQVQELLSVDQKMLHAR